MRTDFETLRELISGFSAGTDTRPAEPTSDGLAARRPRRPLVCELPDALDAREALLNDAAQPDVSIRPLNDDERPWLLFYTDVAPGPDLWGLTPYYGKNSVTIADYTN